MMVRSQDGFSFIILHFIFQLKTLCTSLKKQYILKFFSIAALKLEEKNYKRKKKENFFK